jgi:high-affinity K+ transport system ATPase subunit B
MAPCTPFGVSASLFSRQNSRPVSTLPTHVRRLEIPGDRWSIELTLVARLRHGDSILCVAGDIIPVDGVVVDGSALVEGGVDECRLLGRGSPLSSGARVLTNFVVVRVALLRSA